jgi:hypothetical protein
MPTFTDPTALLQPPGWNLEEIHRKIAWQYEQIPILKAEANSYSPVFASSADFLSKVFTSYAFKLARPSIQDGQEQCLSAVGGMT